MNPRVKSVRALAGHRLRLGFTNGETGLYDCTPLLDTGVFRELRDVAYFRQACVCEGGTVTWPHEQDICPDTLYEDSVKSPPRGGQGTTRYPAARRRKGGRA